MASLQTISIRSYYSKMIRLHPNLFTYSERLELKSIIRKHYNEFTTEEAEIGEIISNKIRITEIILDEIGLGKSAVLSILLYELVKRKLLTVEEIELNFNTQVSSIIQGMLRVEELYERKSSLETENFRKLFLTFAEDIRVILIIIAEHLQIMRNLDSYPEENRQNIAREGSFLYAPLAHRMGLYAIKTEFEDLSLKHTNREIYKEIAQKINETKRSRDQYISEFITPLKKKLSDIGFSFEIKGRTKSIHSIYSKIKKQNTAFENIYDLFAIRVILDVPLEKEKAICWQAYSIVADMYQPNPKRLRDWLSIPKTNGYESLHTTVLGPGGKWVEVQIRTIRMDEIAEKGLA
ncbi:MAG: HD domain-containing protein, partial [Paludibacter sp.]